MMPALKNSRHEIFTQNWFSGETKEKSAIIAKYEPKWATSIGSKLSINPKIVARYNELQEAAASSKVMNRQEMLEAHTEIARGRVGHFLDDNNRIKQDSNLSSAAIQEFDTSEVKIGRGKHAVLATITKLKLHDPVRSMQEIAKLQGHYPKEGAGIGNQENRVINFIVSDPKLIEGISKRLADAIQE